RFRLRRNAVRTSPARAPLRSRASPRPEFSAPAQTAQILQRLYPESAHLVLSRKPRYSVCFFARKKLCIPSARIRKRAHPGANVALSLAHALKRACTSSRARHLLVIPSEVEESLTISHWKHLEMSRRARHDKTERLST